MNRNKHHLRQQALAEGEAAGAEGLGAGGEGALVTFVVGAAGGSFDGDRLVAEGAQIVGAGGHVDLADVPRLKEQAAIAEYLDAKEHESHLISSTIETQIATLAASRKSLIHACVTGQWRAGD